MSVKEIVKDEFKFVLLRVVLVKLVVIVGCATTGLALVAKKYFTPNSAFVDASKTGVFFSIFACL